MDQFKEFPTTLTSPADNAFAVTPDDNAALPVLPRAVYIGQGGALSAVMPGGQTVLFDNVQSGSVLAIRPARIRATSTTASAIVALW